MTKPISIIAAVAKNFALGKNNDLLCHVPGDLKRFKEITTGHTIVMGRKTYDSLPKKPLPKRRNIVITSQKNVSYDGCDLVHSLEQAMELMDSNKENFIIGGASIYKLFLPHSQKLYLTHIYKTFDADVYFPDVDFSYWSIVSEQAVKNLDTIDFDFTYTTYVRKSFENL